MTYILLTLGVLFWSGNFILGRYVHGDIEPLQLALFRWIIVAILLSPILIKNFSLIYKELKQSFIKLNLLAILGVSCFNTLLYVGLNYTKATNALLINSSVPVLILLFSTLILKTPLLFKQVIGILLSTLGVAYLVIKGDFSALSSLSFNVGDIWIVSASCTWALYSVLVKIKPKNLHGMVFFTTVVYIGLFWLSLVYFAMGYSFASDIQLVASNLFVFIYIALFASVLSYLFWHNGIHNIGAAKTGQFAHLMPIFGAVLAYTFLKETMHLYHLFGALFIAAGIYLSLFSSSYPTKPKEFQSPKA